MASVHVLQCNLANNEGMLIHHRQDVARAGLSHRKHPTPGGNAELQGATRHPSVFREFLDSGAAGGIVLMVAAALALIVANSLLAPAYFGALATYLGPLNVEHWVNDGLMAVFFLLVGLEIKRELLDGQLSTWSRRVLPGVGGAGGMVVPALIYVAINSGNPDVLRGWAIPTATDIAFALGVLSLLGIACRRR